MRIRLPAGVRWALVSSAAISGCIVSFEDYPVADPDASAVGGSAGVGASGGSGGIDASWGGGGAGGSAGASASGGAGGGSGATAGAAGVGGSAGSSGSGSAGSGGSGGVSGFGGTAGAAGSGCIPLTCLTTPACGGSVDDGCGGSISCECSDSAGCDLDYCKQVVITSCNGCLGAFASLVTVIPVSFCGACGNGDSLEVCVLPGWETKVQVMTSSACPPGFHLANSLTVTDCNSQNRTICVLD